MSFISAFVDTYLKLSPPDEAGRKFGEFFQWEWRRAK
jgi:hypothetical protein